MSIKIYNGYRLPMMSVAELHSFILKVQEDVLSIQQDMVAQALANIIANDLDVLTVFGEEEFKSLEFKDSESQKLYPFLRPVRKAYRDVKKRYNAIQETGQRDPLVDFDFDIIVIPDDSQMLVLLYTEQKAFREYWESLSDVSFYGYWNNVDPEEGVSPEEWEKRKTDWLRLWPDDQPAKQIGLTISIIKGVPEIYEIPEERIVEKMPSLEDRLKDITFNKAFDEKYKEWKQENTEFMDVYRKTNRWLRTEEGKDYLDRVREHTQKRVIPSITQEWLGQSFPAIYQANQK